MAAAAKNDANPPTANDEPAEIVRLLTNDGTVNAAREIVCLCATVSNMVDDIGVEHALPLPLVDVATMRWVLRLLDLVAWLEPGTDQRWVLKDALSTSLLGDLLDLAAAVNYLDAPTLLEAVCSVIAHRLRVNSKPAALRALFGIDRDLSAEEEREAINDPMEHLVQDISQAEEEAECAAAATVWPQHLPDDVFTLILEGRLGGLATAGGGLAVK